MMTHVEIPQDVLRSFTLEDVIKITRVGGGMINQTFYVTQKNGEKWVVQSLSAIFDTAVTSDAVAVTDFLRVKGWSCPTFKKTIGGNLHVFADNRVWRVMQYVEHVPFDGSAITLALYENIGALLGKLHRDLAQCTYTPQFQIEGFHDQQYYLATSRRLDWSECDADIQAMVREVQKLLGGSGNFFQKDKQLIHGDPRIENIFFTKDNRPFLFIDYDTFMEHSIYVDIGDCVRSLAGLTKHTTSKVIVAFTAGYNTTSENKVTVEAVEEAFTTIVLELTLRFLNDSVEDCYFEWDREKFASRKESNIAHAKDLWAVYMSTQD